MVLSLMSRVAGCSKNRRDLSRASHRPASPLFATLTSRRLTISKHTTLTLLFATLTKNASVSPLLATLTKNTRGGSRVYSPRRPRRYLLTLFYRCTYTHFSLSHEDLCT